MSSLGAPVLSLLRHQNTDVYLSVKAFYRGYFSFLWSLEFK